VPRRHRSARDRTTFEEAPAPANLRGGFRPTWAQIDGVVVRQVTGEAGKTYRCPGCQQPIRPGVAHLVVIEGGDVGSRRHWHIGCWRTELRRRGHHRHDV
jgi:hypothetical protein